MKPIKRKSLRQMRNSSCLLCSSHCSFSEGKKKPKLADFGIEILGGQNCTLLTNQLEKIFILLKILDIPKSWCEQLLSKHMDEDSMMEYPLDPSESWFNVCHKCTENTVAKAWEIHQNLVNLQARMTSLKKKVKEKMRKEMENKKRHYRSLQGTTDCEIRKLLFPEYFDDFTSLSPFVKDNYRDHQYMEFDDSSSTLNINNNNKQEASNALDDFLDLNIKTEIEEVNKDDNYQLSSAGDCQPNSGGHQSEDDDYQPEMDGNWSDFMSDCSNNESEDGDTGSNKTANVHRIRQKKRKQTHISTNSYYRIMCRTCGSRFRSAAEYDTHQLAHQEVGEDGEFACDRCTFPATTADELKEHQKRCYRPKGRKPGPKPGQRRIKMPHLKFRPRNRCRFYDCPKCPLRADSWMYLKEHVDQRHSEMTEDELQAAGLSLKCPLCEGMEFKNYNKLLLHRRNIHLTVSKRTCRICKTRLKTLAKFEAHQKAHEEVGPNGEFICPQCKFPSRTAEELELHIKRRHMRLELLQNKKMYSCPQCELKTEKWYTLKEHITREHPSMTKEELDAAGFIVRCHLCGGREFESWRRLSDHNWKVHPELEATNEGNSVQPVNCSHCQLKFPSQKQLSFHVRTVHEQHSRRFVCDECGMGFTTNSNLKKHKEKHLDRSERKRLICDLCGLDFLGIKEYKIHQQKSHPKDDDPSSSSSSNPAKVFKCRFCPLTSPIALVIKRHLETHKEELGHRCEECGRCYTSAQGLKRHIRINHSKSGPWTCPYCSKTFLCEDYMKDHIRTHCHLKRLAEGEQIASDKVNDQFLT